MSHRINPTPDERDAMAISYRAGVSIRRIAIAYRYSYRVVRQALLDNGVALRGRGTYPRSNENQ
jgi:hypothetical protein